MVKRVFIVHGWRATPEESWFPWLKKELEGRGFEVYVPAMPDTNAPTINRWVSFLREQVGMPDEETYFVGHSAGAQAILRYLETIDKKIGGAVFAAGFVYFNIDNLETEKEREVAKPWIKTPIDFSKIRNTTNNFVAIFSDNDPFVEPKNAKIFKAELGARIVIEHNMGHLGGGYRILKLPVVLSELLKIAK